MRSSPGYLLKRAQLALRNRMDAELRELDLTTPQFAILDALSRAKAGLSNAELARRCFVSAQATHGVVVALERRGLLQRPDEADVGRARYAILTGDGSKLHRRANRVVERIVRLAFGDLSSSDRAELVKALRSVVERLG